MMNYDTHNNEKEKGGVAFVVSTRRFHSSFPRRRRKKSLPLKLFIFVVVEKKVCR